MKGLPTASGLLIACLLAGCSSGGSNPSPPPPPPPPPPPSALSYPAPPAFTINTAIAQLTPTVAGNPTSYAVAPALPAGLALNTTSGVVSGTPTALQAATNHTVTATNGSGSTTATLAITVNDVVPTLSYPRSNYTFNVATPIAPLSPTTGGGAVTNWSIDRTLPAGLTFNTGNGQITGTPTAESAASNYVVTARNSGGPATYTLTLAVQSGVLVDLGHAHEIMATRYLGNRVMSIDEAGVVLLHDAQTGARVLTVGADVQLCSFPCALRAQFAGNTVVVRQITSYEVYSAQTGALLAQVPAHYASPANPWTLASDGSYFAESSITGVSAWSVAGTSILTKLGDYRNARMFAAPGQLRVANAPGFSQAIEFIALPGGTSTSSPAYSGTFYSWFQDGASFITRTGSNVATIYSHDGVLLSTANHSQFQGLGGEGNWFWAHSTSFVEIFAVGGASTPAATYTFATNNYSRLLASGSTIALIQGTANYINVIDLTGSVPQLVARTTTTFNNSSYAARSPTDWIHGNESGVLSGAPGSALPVHYTYGRARSIAGSRTRAAVATSTGQILFFNAARSLEGTIAFDSSKLALSNDGNVLGAEANDSEGLLFADRTLRMYSLPSGAVLAEWPGSINDTDVPINFELSGSGDVAGQVTQREVGTGIFETTRRTVRFDNTVLWSQSAGSGSRLLLSTSGLRVAVPNGDGFDTGSSTNIYSNGVFSGSIAAAPVCWLDDARLLVTRYNSASSRSPLIIDPSGQTVATPGGPLPELRVCQPLDTNTIYSPELNDILNLTTGLPVWSSQAESSQMLGAATDAYVAFASGATVRAESR